MDRGAWQAIQIHRVAKRLTRLKLLSMQAWYAPFPLLAPNQQRAPWHHKVRVPPTATLWWPHWSGREGSPGPPLPLPGEGFQLNRGMSKGRERGPRRPWVWPGPTLASKASPAMTTPAAVGTYSLWAGLQLQLLLIHPAQEVLLLPLPHYQ